MQNRRRSDLKQNGLAEKKICLRCYRLHKKCDGLTPNCTRCVKAKTTCVYTYSTTTPLASNTQQAAPNVTELQQNLTTLQKYVDQQKNAFQALEAKFDRLEKEKRELEIANMKLSEVLMQTNLMQEKDLSSKSQMQDILLSYHTTGFFFMRVNPLVSEARLYLQEKMLGNNPLKTAAMDLIFGSVFILAGKADRANEFINNAKSILLANNTNNPLGLLCSHLMSKNHYLMGQTKVAMDWCQKVHNLFKTISPHNMPHRAKHVENQIKILSQVMDVDYAKHASITFLQWAPQHISTKRRAEQYKKQLNIHKHFENTMSHEVVNCCGMATFLATKLWSEILIIIEDLIDNKGQAQVISSETLFHSFNQLLEFASMVTDQRLVLHLRIIVAVYKLFIAIVTANYALLDQLLNEAINTGCFEQLYPNPLDATHLFILMQLLYFLRSPFYNKALSQFEAWSTGYPFFGEYFNKWQKMLSTEPLFAYPVELNQMDDYMVVLPHLYYMQMHNIALSIHLPIFPSNSVDLSNPTNIDSLLLSAFDGSDSFIDFNSDSSTSDPSIMHTDSRQESSIIQLEFTDEFDM